MTWNQTSAAVCGDPHTSVGLRFAANVEPTMYAPQLTGLEPSQMSSESTGGTSKNECFFFDVHPKETQTGGFNLGEISLLWIHKGIHQEIQRNEH